jgi:hypothetical protein
MRNNFTVRCWMGFERTNKRTHKPVYGLGPIHPPCPPPHAPRRTRTLLSIHRCTRRELTRFPSP